MENFEYSIQLSDKDWADFSAAAEECGLLQAALASGDEPLSSDIDQGDSSGSSPPGPPPPRILRLQAGSPPPEGLLKALGRRPLPGHLATAQEGCSGSEEEEGTGTRLVSRFRCERVLAPGPGQQTQCTSTQLEEQLPSSVLHPDQLTPALVPESSPRGSRMQKSLPEVAAQASEAGVHSGKDPPRRSPSGQEQPSSLGSTDGKRSPREPNTGASPKSPGKKKRRSAGAKGSSSPKSQDTKRQAPPSPSLAQPPSLGPQPARGPSTKTHDNVAPAALEGSGPASVSPIQEAGLGTGDKASHGKDPQDPSSTSDLVGVNGSAPAPRQESFLARSLPGSKTEAGENISPSTRIPEVGENRSTPIFLPEKGGSLVGVAPKAEPGSNLSTSVSKDKPQKEASTSDSKTNSDAGFSMPPPKSELERDQSTRVLLTKADVDPAFIPKAQPNVNLSTPAPKAQLDVNLSTPAPKAQPDVNLSTPAPKAQPDVNLSTPAPKAQPDVNLSTPAPKAQLYVNLSTPAPKTQPDVNLSTPAPKAQPDVNLSTPAPKAQPDVNLSTPAPKAQPDVNLSTPAPKAQPDVNLSTPAPKAQPDVNLSTPAPKAQPDVNLSTPALKAQPDVNLSTPSPKAQPDVNLPTPALKVQPDVNVTLSTSAPRAGTAVDLATPDSKAKPDMDLSTPAQITKSLHFPVFPQGLHGEPEESSKVSLAPGPLEEPSLVADDASVSVSPGLVTPARVPRRKKVRFSGVSTSPQENSVSPSSALPDNGISETPRTLGGARGGPRTWDAVAVGARPQPRILKHSPSPSALTRESAGPREEFALTLPEAYDYFFCDTIVEEEEEEEEEEEDIPSNLQWPEVCEYFFRDSRLPGQTVPPGPPLQVPDPVDPVPISIPEAYEHFFWEEGSPSSNWGPLTLSNQHTPGPERAPLQVWPRLSVPEEQNPGKAEELGLTVNLEGNSKRWQFSWEQGASLIPFTINQNDMCLGFVAFATWAVRTSDLHAPDAWKTVLLANIGAISAIRYFRKQTRKGRPCP